MTTTPEAAPKPCHVERKTCRSCDAKTLVPVLDLGNQYLSDFVDEPDTTLPKAPLELVRCADCGLLQLFHTAERDTLYRKYWYRSSINATMKAALSDLVKSAAPYHGGGVWLDIGANDGFTLSRVPNKFHKIACEPARVFSHELEEHADVVISDYFTAAGIGGHCDVITSAAMFYDLDDPNRFVEDIRTSLSKTGVWINQLNDSPTMLKQNAFDAICHEHLCYYSLQDLECLYERNGLKIVDVTYNDVNGGSVRVFAMHRNYPPAKYNLSMTEAVKKKDVDQFSNRVVRWRSLMNDILYAGRISSKSIWCYGASTKGNCLLQYLGAEELMIACADRNPDKNGKRMVGSWLPITSEEEMRKAKPDILIVLPWAFRKEFVERESDLRGVGTAMFFPLPNPEFVL